MAAFFNEGGEKMGDKLMQQANKLVQPSVFSLRLKADWEHACPVFERAALTYSVCYPPVLASFFVAATRSSPSVRTSLVRGSPCVTFPTSVGVSNAASKVI
jgi:hypothetical protein